MKKARLPDWPPSGRSKGLLVLRESALAISSRLNVDFDRDEDQLGVIWKPLDVQGEIVAPAFGQPGLGVQYMTDLPVADLIELGFLKPVG